MTKPGLKKVGVTPDAPPTGFKPSVGGSAIASGSQTSALSDKKLREVLNGVKGFRRDYPGEPWVFMAEERLFAALREFATNIRADERRRCLSACRGAVNASDARSRIRALTDAAGSEG